MKTVFLAMSLLALVGCSTTKYQAQEIETKEFQVKGSAHDGKIGLNDKKQLVIKNERSVTFELQVQDMVNMRLRDRVESDLHMLKLCRRDLADPRLGGSGKVSSIPAIDNLRPVPEIREEMGIDEDGNLKIVSEEFLEERLKAERRYEKELRGMGDLAEKHREECETEMKYARLKAGLPGKRFQGDGYCLGNNCEKWVQTLPNENDLDDAFEIKASRAPAPKAERPSGTTPYTIYTDDRG